MISASDRMEAYALITEAVELGARLSLACKELKLSERTFYRWKSEIRDLGCSEDKRPTCDRPEPANKLTKEERQKVLDTANEERFMSMPPCEIVPALADEGTYIASESTMYRILREEKMLRHRGRADEPQHKQLSTYCATAPNQVWMWDITWLKGPIKGSFFYLYMIIDLFSRDIVGWEVWAEESAEHASELIRRTCISQRRLSTQPTVLHSDNGSPMKGATMLQTLYDLGITPSNSRPRVSNDNAYAESIFKTLKFCPKFPYSGFADIEAARQWCLKFVHWYRCEHHHSGICFLTPAAVHSGIGNEILEKRTVVYETARAAHPERWNGRNTRDWSLPAEVYLNPDRQPSEPETASTVSNSENVSTIKEDSLQNGAASA